MYNVQKTAGGQLIFGFFERESKLAKRSFEKETVHFLLNELSLNPADLTYGEKGNPILLNNANFISISHSNGYFALYISKFPNGVDIQTFKERMSGGSHFFLTEEEKKWSSHIDLHLIWSAKEAIFKKMKGEFSNYLLEISVIELDKEHHRLLVSYFGKTEELHFLLSDKMVLVYTIES